MTSSKLAEFRRLDNEATLKIENSNKKKVSLPSISDERKQVNSSVNPKHKGPLEASFNIQARDTLDLKLQ